MTTSFRFNADEAKDYSNLIHILSFFLCRSDETQTKFNGRALSKFRSIVHGVKRSLKKIFFAWTYYGPEVGLCSCMFKYAWFTYPIVPEVSHAVMGRARRMVSGFLNDFWQGYANSQSSDDQYRISNKVADTTADDYYDYQSSNKVYGAFRRNGQQQAANFVEKAPIVEKVNPQLFNVVDMLKNLQPKMNVSDFVIRLARNIKFQPQNPHNVQQFRTVSDEFKYFPSNHQRDETKATGNAAKPPTSEINRDKVIPDNLVVVDGRSFVQSGFKTNVSQIATKKLFDLAPGPPPGLPSYNELPPADYSYYKGGIHHHVHDLRKDKGSYPSQVKGGGWLAFDFEDVILQALGLSNPGRSIKPSVVKCSKAYIFNVILRFVQTTLLH